MIVEILRRGYKLWYSLSEKTILFLCNREKQNYEKLQF